MCCGKRGKLRGCACGSGVVWVLRKGGESQRWGGVRGRLGGLTGAHVEFRAAHAVVSGWTVVKTLPVLSHPLPPQKQEEFGLAVYTAVVPGAHRAAFTDGVRSIASCRTNTEEQTAKVISKMELNTERCCWAVERYLKPRPPPTHASQLHAMVGPACRSRKAGRV